MRLFLARSFIASFMKRPRLAIAASALLILSACSSPPKPTSQSSRYQQAQDAYPANPPDVSQIPDAVPQIEPFSRSGNGPTYRVLGKTYRVLPHNQGYQAIGYASWYGTKFHGHATSNGEIYDMYKMTAAHKHLPLPTYARVTNLENGRQVIVRVNDRGPFHDNRLIDLSYAAAHRLGFHQKGTAKVKVEAIDPKQWQAQQNQVWPVYLQVASLSSAPAAEKLKARLIQSLGLPVRIQRQQIQQQTWYRIQAGPLYDQNSLNQASTQVRGQGLGQPLVVNP
ncbi:rare lipoprotein A [Allopseudospirillum japonicum]|uniref:Endolytic peptidoglycan transglycosylase RlpA n=2 Tax=Allopseudospirillum japonicum TaxID=64971 RepID=A0A1H6SRI7_9GAMM|nr:rare lipoprotein A [Allopseudospirillum japonicum]